MALSREDLQAIAELLAPINEKLDALQEDVTHIKEVSDIYYKWTDAIELRVKTLERA